MKRTILAIDQRGYSLLELLMVIVLVSLLTAWGLHGWQQWQRQQQLILTAQQLQAFLLRVRQQAHWYNHSYELWVAQGSETWCVGSSREPITLPSCQPPPGTLLWTAPFADIALIELRGTPTFHGQRDKARAGSIAFGHAQQQRRLMISNKARIRVCNVTAKECL